MEAQHYIYQVVHTIAHHPLYLDEHCRLLEDCCMEIYFKPLYLDREEIHHNIVTLLKQERVTQDLSIFVEIRIDRDGKLSLILSEISIYDGYSLRCLSPSVESVMMTIPFGPYHTSIRRQVIDFANDIAKNLGGDMAVICNNSGSVDSIGGGALFGLANRKLIASTSFLNVERQIVIEAAKECQLEVIEAQIQLKDLSSFDELFFCDHYGITAVSRYAKRLYPSINAQKIAEKLATPWIGIL